RTTARWSFAGSTHLPRTRPEPSQKKGPGRFAPNYFRFLWIGVLPCLAPGDGGFSTPEVRQRRAGGSSTRDGAHPPPPTCSASKIVLAQPSPLPPDPRP